MKEDILLVFGIVILAWSVPPYFTKLIEIAIHGGKNTVIDAKSLSLYRCEFVVGIGLITCALI